MEEVNEVVSMRQLLECGVHFGHQTKRWNPKMKKYIFTSRNGIHVIDLQQTMQLINVAYEFVKEVIKNDGDILFVGTKKQAQEAVEQESTRCDMPYVNYRWLGGTLTNISTIRQSINKLKDHERLKNTVEFENLTKKEQSLKNKNYQKSNRLLLGIKNMIKTPSALFVVDTKKEQLCINEARRLNIPIIGVVDTNADPNEVDYPIPANDDAIRAVKLICSVVSDAVIKGKEERIVFLQEEEERKAKEAEIKEAENAKKAKDIDAKNKNTDSDKGPDVNVPKEKSKGKDTPKKEKIASKVKESKEETQVKKKDKELKAPAKNKSALKSDLKKTIAKKSDSKKASTKKDKGE